MIPAEEALALAAERRPRAVEPTTLTDEEAVALGYIDYTIEQGIVATYNGEVFDIKIPAEVAKSANVIAALKRRYEAGRWSVGVFPHVENDDVAYFQLTFAAKEVAIVPKAEVPMPIIMPAPIGEIARGQKRLLLRMPTRSRPQQAIEVLAKYRAMAGTPILMEVVVDEDDESITPQVLYRFQQLGIVVTWGQHKSKIQACNGGKLHEWDILVLASDDMVPVAEGWASRIIELFDEHWPHLEGAIHLNDGNTGSKLYTLPIIGRRLYDEFGYVYAPEFRSLWCDNDQQDVYNAMNRLVYVDEVLIEHRHPGYGKARVDPLYVRNDALWDADKEIYELRKADGFGLVQPLLSILICTFPARRELLERLLIELYHQKSTCLHEIEIVIDHKPAPSLGEKRQRLLDRARGSYVCFVDDDDMVSFDYIDRICAALITKPDCASFVGEMLVNGEKVERFEHSLKYKAWLTREDGLHVRSPNHLNAVKTEIARKVGFENLTYSEDHAYSRAIQPLLRIEADVGEASLYTYFFTSKDMPTGAVR